MLPRRRDRENGWDREARRRPTKIAWVRRSARGSRDENCRGPTCSPADPAVRRAGPVRGAAPIHGAAPVHGAAPSRSARTPCRTRGIDTRAGSSPCCRRGYVRGPRDRRCGTAGRCARSFPWGEEEWHWTWPTALNPHNGRAAASGSDAPGWGTPASPSSYRIRRPGSGRALRARPGSSGR